MSAVAAAVRRAIAVDGEVHGLDTSLLPGDLRVTRRGPDVTVHVGDASVRGRVSAHPLLAGRVWGLLLAPADAQPFSLWLPGTDPQDWDRTARVEPGQLWRREGLLAGDMAAAGLELRKAGEEQEARLCFRRSQRGSPAEPRATGSEREVPLDLREAATRRTLAEDATSRRPRWGLEGAVRAVVLPYAAHDDPIERASAAQKLGSICEGISSSDPVRLHRLAGAALLALLADPEPWVREPALDAAVTLAHRLRRDRQHALALPLVEALLAEGVARREMLAWRFEARLALGEREGAAADWAAVDALAGLPPHRAIEVQPGHYDRTPAWTEYRAAAEARASEPPRDRRRRAKA